MVFFVDNDCCGCYFFFKQKTAYELRISDWSSDVCSSDLAAWAPFIKAGYEDMVKNAIHGVGAMPPKGGNPSLSDFEVERAVVYIANQSGASFEEPKEPAGDAAADEAKPTETADRKSTRLNSSH